VENVYGPLVDLFWRRISQYFDKNLFHYHIFLQGYAWDRTRVRTASHGRGVL